MNKAYLLTGGNTGNPKQQLKQALQLIAANCGLITQQSSIYETAAWGNTDQPPFLNQALELMTPLSPDSLMQALLKIEETMGRKRTEKYASRLIDIDILLYNYEVIDSSLVIIPHPQLANRRFALAPLNQLAASYIHPILQKSIARLLEDCEDMLAVKRIS